MPSRLGRALVGIVLAALAFAGAAPPVVRILFIGNSLTVANDLPRILTAMARSVGRPLTYRVVAFPDFSLEDHWARGDAQHAIAEGGWSFVVLQQGPSALPESQVLLREYTRRFAGEAGKVGARTALFMVWPSDMRPFDFAGVHASYKAAADDVRGLFLPAGDAWQEAWRRQPKLELYGPDGFHPTAAGSYLAAAVIFQGVFRESPIGLPAIGVTAGVARTLQEAAVAAGSR
jgi:hypothetical protein